MSSWVANKGILIMGTMSIFIVSVLCLVALFSVRGEDSLDAPLAATEQTANFDASLAGLIGISLVSGVLMLSSFMYSTRNSYGAQAFNSGVRAYRTDRMNNPNQYVWNQRP